jgi:DNA-nicking Smr family endonuclease
MSGRRVSPDEAALWRKVAQSAERLHRERKPDGGFPQPKPKPMKRAVMDLQPFTMGGTAKMPADDLAKPVTDRVAQAPLRMDRKAHAKLKRGKLRPEGKLDLHGMTLERAHPQLVGFILRAQADGKRLVLVVTGKGKHRDDDGPIPVRHGVLRHQVPHWLSVPPLSQAVLQVTQAHRSHGGGGAYYVYLRRIR